MPNELDRVTWEHTTQACPQLTQRFRTGPAVEFTAWLLLHLNRAQAQYNGMPDDTSEDVKQWSDGMKRYLINRITTLNSLIQAVPDRFPRVEWNAATDTVKRWMDTYSDANLSEVESIKREAEEHGDNADASEQL